MTRNPAESSGASFRGPTMRLRIFLFVRSQLLSDVKKFHGRTCLDWEGTTGPKFPKPAVVVDSTLQYFTSLIVFSCHIESYLTTYFSLRNSLGSLNCLLWAPRQKASLPHWASVRRGASIAAYGVCSLTAVVLPSSSLNFHTTSLHLHTWMVGPCIQHATTEDK